MKRSVQVLNKLVLSLQQWEGYHDQLGNKACCSPAGNSEGQALDCGYKGTSSLLAEDKFQHGYLPVLHAMYL